jgi:PAS domain S-box-containing protein
MPIDTSVLEKIYSNDPTLKNVVVSNQNLNDDDLIILIDALKVNTHIESIDVSGNIISDNGIKILASPDCKFTSLIASDCKIKDLSTLLNINRLVSITLASNEITPESIALISVNKVLRYMSLAGNNLKDDEAIVLANTTSITSLILSHNKITATGAKALANNSSIYHLNLNHNHLRSEGVIALADNTTLRELRVAGNRVSMAGIKSLANNKTYTTLDVSYNKIGNSEAAELLQHPTIVNLNLSYNEISFEGVNALPEGTPLEQLNISYNFLKDAGIIVVARHRSIRRLDASCNGIGFDGTYALAMNKVLVSLVYSTNFAGDSGAVILAQNTTLTELNLSYNGIKDAGATTLANNTTLRKLNLNYNLIGKNGKDALLKNKTLENLILSPEQPPEFTDENLDRIFSISESFLCICDLKGTLQYFNPSFPRALGRTQDELLGKSFFKYLHQADTKSLQEQLTIDENVIIYNHENRYECLDGSYRTISWTSNIINSRMYAVGTDITDKRRIEKDLLYVEQLALLNRVIEAESYNKRQREFISHLSHEIRNPLTGILGLIISLGDQVEVVEKVMRSLSKVCTITMQETLTESFAGIAVSLKEMAVCAKYQKEILNRSILVVQLAEKKLTLNKDPFELKTLLLEITSMYNVKAKEKGLVLKHEFPELDVLWVKGDYLRFKQIVVNLVGNAVKFTKAGSIKIKCMLSKQTADHVHVDVSIIDTGIGLNLTEQGALFRRFSQPVTGSTYGGSGIGLYLSRELAQAMDGDISVKSEKLKGSDFCVSILFEKASFMEVEVQASKNELNPSKPHELKSSPAHLLVVEDNVTNQKMLCNILTKHSHRWKLAQNGQEAVDAYVTASNEGWFYDIILMDIQMPIMDGLQATAEIRRIEIQNKYRRTPIIAITANAQEADKQKGIEAGSDYYLTKPYNARNILKKISEYNNQNSTEMKLTTSQTLTRLDSAAPSIALPAVLPLILSPRANSTPLSSTSDVDNRLSPIAFSPSELTHHTLRMFKSTLAVHSENVPTVDPLDSKIT